jgi:hypothetical protein
MLSSAPNAHAVLMTADSGLGVDTITADSDTGLEWLDLPLSAGFSFNTIQPELNAGGMFDGFRLAARVEVETLWANAGIPVINGGSSPANQAPVIALIDDFIGQTDSQGGFPEAFAFTGDLSGTSVFRGMLDFAGVVDPYSATTTNSQGLGTAFSSFGAWLVRSTSPPLQPPTCGVPGTPDCQAPEPTTLALLGLGLVGMAARTRKRRFA